MTKPGLNTECRMPNIGHSFGIRHSAFGICLFMACLACAGGLGRPDDLMPGFGTVERRDPQQQIEIRFDPDSKLTPALLQGQTLAVRRLAKTVYLPQSWRPLAQDWLNTGTAQVLPASRTGGALVATLLWEDEKNPVKQGDRVELCRVPPEAAKPAILSLQVAGATAGLPSREGSTVGQADRGTAAAAPGEELLLAATVHCPTGAPPQCEWTVDAGEFVLAGGKSAGKTLRGPALARWRAPLAPVDAGVPGIPSSGSAKITLKVSAGGSGEAVEQSLAVAIKVPKEPYSKVQVVATRVPGATATRLGPLFSEAGPVAAGALTSFYLADAPNRRLLHWSPAGPRYVPLENTAVAALGSSDGAAWLVQGASLLRCKPEEKALAKVAALPKIERLAGVGINATGDVFALDSGAQPRFRVLLNVDGGSWSEAALKPAVDSPWLARCCVDPLSNDLYILNSRDKMIQVWQALQGIDYHPLDVPIAVGAAMDQHGAPVALIPRGDCDRGDDLPIQLVFKNGEVTEKWTGQGATPKWEPSVAGPPRQLRALRFTAAHAAPLSDGDILLAGQATAEGDTTPMVAQLSARGEFRRMLPLPELPPRWIAAAPSGQRYVLLGRRGQRLALLDADGWMTEDLPAVKSISSVAHIRPDRSSSDHVFVVGTSRGLEAVVRLCASDPAISLDLTSGGIPGARKIPDHQAVDVASSSEHLLILDRAGKVLVFANQRPPQYLGEFDSGLRRPAAIAVLSKVTRRGDPENKRRTYVCVLPSGRQATCVHLWELKTEGGSEPAGAKIGVFPDPERFPAAVQLASPVTMDTGFPDAQGTLFVLDRGGSQVRAFDVPEIAFKIGQGLVPDMSATPLIDSLPFKGDALDMAVGPGQVIHIVDEKSEAVHTYARRP